MSSALVTPELSGVEQRRSCTSGVFFKKAVLLFSKAVEFDHKTHSNFLRVPAMAGHTKPHFTRRSTQIYYFIHQGLSRP